MESFGKLMLPRGQQTVERDLLSQMVGLARQVQQGELLVE
jgi:hypothetical protein